MIRNYFSMRSGACRRHPQRLSSRFYDAIGGAANSFSALPGLMLGDNRFQSAYLGWEGRSGAIDGPASITHVGPLNPHDLAFLLITWRTGKWFTSAEKKL